MTLDELHAAVSIGDVQKLLRTLQRSEHVLIPERLILVVHRFATHEIVRSTGFAIDYWGAEDEDAHPAGLIDEHLTRLAGELWRERVGLGPAYAVTAVLVRHGPAEWYGVDGYWTWAHLAATGYSGLYCGDFVVVADNGEWVAYPGPQTGRLDAARGSCGWPARTVGLDS